MSDTPTYRMGNWCLPGKAGEVTIYFPTNMDMIDVEDTAEWLELTLRTMRKMAEANERAKQDRRSADERMLA